METGGQQAVASGPSGHPERTVSTTPDPISTPPPARARRPLPSVALTRPYRRAWLRDDLLAGLVISALLVPQGMAYAELAGLPAVTGLYATMIPLLAYALVGPSRILVLGPDSAVAPMVAAVVVPLAADGDERVALAGLLALLVGAVCMAGGLARFGFITELLSTPVRVGYLAGIALTVLVGQVPKLMGVDVPSEGVLEQLRSFAEGLDGVDGPSTAIGVACVAVILGARRISRRIPGVLVAVVGATVAVALLDLDVDVVGALPGGLPVPGLPDVDGADMVPLALGAVGIALVAFADTSILSRSYAARLGDRVDQNHELFALGASNAAAGLFQGFPMSSSSSRTPVAEAAGARTQLTGVVGALTIGVLLVAAPGLLADLPQAALAAVVVTAVLGLADVGWLRRTFRVRRSEFVLAVAAMAGVVLLGVLWGVLAAVGLSLLNFLRRAWRPHDAVLGRAEGVKGYHDVTRYPEARQVPGLLLFRFDAPLWFANAEAFRARVLELVEAAPRPVRRVVVAAEPITDVDTTAAEILADLHGDLAARGIGLAFAELKDPVRDRLRAYGLLDVLGDENLHPTIGVAVRAFVTDTGVDWTDWEEGRT